MSENLTTRPEIKTANPTYAQGEEVTFDLSETVKGIKGKVCGVVGPVIIVDVTGQLKNYSYTHIYILDAQITK